MTNDKGPALSLPKGFTMIELLITVSITALMITLGTSSYRAAQLRQSLRSDVETSLELLQKAKKQAIVGDQDCDDPSGPSLGVKVTFTQDLKNVQFQALCKTSNGTITTTVLKDSAPITSATFTFRALDGSLSGNGGQSMTLKTPDGLSTTITVSQAGAITYEQAP